MSIFSDLFTVTVQVNPPDEEFMRLSREATEAKKAKDWGRAIDCLRQIKDRVLASGDFPSCMRLPLFLQQAGRFDEAMAEFNLLIQQTKPRIDREFAHALPSVRRSVVASTRMRIYDKMRLACQRQKLPRETERYAKLYEQQRELWAKLKPLAKGGRRDV
ncbi:MAG: hypothetical protein WC073_10915 [Sterolibacterium sp.]